MSKFKYIRADVYRRGISIFIGTKEALLEFAKETFKDNEDLIHNIKESLNDTNALATTYQEEYGQSVIWIPKFPKTPTQVANLAHEVLHATFCILDFVNVEYRYGGPNEPYTYLFDYLLTKALTERGYRDV